MDEDRTGPELRVTPGRVVWRQLGEEAVLLDLQTSRYLATNGPAALLWRRLDAGTTRDELVAALLAEYDVTREEAAADVDEFLADCRDRGLLEAS